MKTHVANEKLNSILEKVEKNGVSATGLIEDLKDLREIAQKEQDPLVTKVLRLTYEYLQENSAFDVQAQFEESTSKLKATFSHVRCFSAVFSSPSLCAASITLRITFGSGE